jgi:hypothetical protein
MAGLVNSIVCAPSANKRAFIYLSIKGIVMSTETVVAPEAEVKPSKVIPELDSFTDAPMVSLVVTKAQALVDKLKGVAAKVNAAGNIGELLSEAIKQSEDPEVKQALARIEKANEAILNWQKEIEAKVKPTLAIPSDEEIKAAEEEYKNLVSNVKTLDSMFTMEVGANHPELNIYDYVGELPKAKRSASGAKSGQGEGSSRPRVSEIAVSTDNGQSYTKVEKDGKSTFSVLTQWLKKETGETIGASDLHEAWFGQNGDVKDWNVLPEQTTFNYSLKDKSYFIRVTK